jgi:hypothetical protein
VLTSGDILAEVRRLTGKQVIGISMVDDLVNVNDGSGRCVTVRITQDTTAQQFGVLYTEATRHAD